MDIALHLSALSLDEASELPKQPKFHEQGGGGDGLCCVKATLELIEEWEHWANESEDLIRVCADRIAEMEISNERAEKDFNEMLDQLAAYPARPFLALTKESVEDMIREYGDLLREFAYISWMNWCPSPCWLYGTMRCFIREGTRKTSKSSKAVKADSADFGMSGLSLSSRKSTTADVPALLEAKIGARRDGGRDMARERKDIIILLRKVFPKDDEQWRHFPEADQIDEGDVRELAGEVDSMVIQ